MRRGFTLVELLVVIGIVVVLIVLAVPAIGSLRARGASTKCLANLRQLGVALNLYLGENDQRMPVIAAGRASSAEDAGTIDVVLADYVGGNRAVFACPADARLAATTGTSYYWNVALNGQAVAGLNFLRFFEAKAGIPVLTDKEGWHTAQKPKVNILYADGHAGGEFKLFTGP